MTKLVLSTGSQRTKVMNKLAKGHFQRSRVGMTGGLGCRSTSGQMCRQLEYHSLFLTSTYPVLRASHYQVLHTALWQVQSPLLIARKCCYYRKCKVMTEAQIRNILDCILLYLSLLSLISFCLISVGIIFVLIIAVV